MGLQSKETFTANFFTSKLRECCLTRGLYLDALNIHLALRNVGRAEVKSDYKTDGAENDGEKV